MSASKATRVIHDSHLPDESAAMPLYAVLSNGEFTLLAVQDTHCLTFTPAGLKEVQDNYHTHHWLNDALARKGIDTAWMDEEFAFTCQICQKPLSECKC